MVKTVLCCVYFITLKYKRKIPKREWGIFLEVIIRNLSKRAPPTTWYLPPPVSHPRSSPGRLLPALLGCSHLVAVLCFPSGVSSLRRTPLSLLAFLSCSRPLSPSEHSSPWRSLSPPGQTLCSEPLPQAPFPPSPSLFLLDSSLESVFRVVTTPHVPISSRAWPFAFGSWALV